MGSLPDWANRAWNGAKPATRAFWKTITTVGTLLGFAKAVAVPISWTNLFEIFTLAVAVALVVFVRNAASTPTQRDDSPARPVKVVHPGTSPDLLRRAPAILVDIDREAYGTADSFDEEELSALLRRFPKAVALLQRDSTSGGEPSYSGYLSAFPISLRAAKQLVEVPTREDYALPCTSRDPSRAIFRTSEVPTTAELAATSEVAWYVDSVVHRRDSAGVDSPLDTSLLQLLRETVRTFRASAQRTRIQSIYTITHTDRGKDLVGLSADFLAAVGFGNFVEVWSVGSNTCWHAVRTGDRER